MLTLMIKKNPRVDEATGMSPNADPRRRDQSTRLAMAVALLVAVVGLLMTVELIVLRADNSDFEKEFTVSIGSGEGIVSKPSRYPVDNTVSRLITELNNRGVTLFAVVDHSGEAAKVGMAMRPTKLLIFGNPNCGTPVMVAAPSSAIDLPLKLLVWQDGDDHAWVSYNAPEYLQKRHHLPAELLRNLAVVEGLVKNVAE
jgi:uncharacterized protein (DUF302 family)